MKLFLQGLFFLVCFFSSVNVSAASMDESFLSEYQEKLYFDSSDLEIIDSAIYIHLENNLIKTNVIRTDQQGFYIFGNDITNYAIANGREKEWKCPYCNHWSPMGKKCQNKDCPTNQW